MLKKLDIFSSQLHLNIRREQCQHSKTRTYISEYTSYFGFIVTVFYASICFAYFTYLLVRMYHLHDDDYKSQVMLNTMDEPGLVELNLTDYNFMSAVWINPMNTSEDFS